MSSDRPRLLVPSGALPSEARVLDLLRSVFDVVEVESVGRAAEGRPDDLILLPSGEIADAVEVAGLPAGGVISTLENIGEGVGVIDASGTMTWANARLSEYDEPIRERFIETCRQAMQQFDQAGQTAVALRARPARKFVFAVGSAHYEVLVSIATVEEARERAVSRVVGILWEVTESRELQNKIDAIDAAGAELMRIDAASIAGLNVAERLALLEEKIVRYVRDLLNFDKFEVRIIDRETNQLELVFNHGLTPLKIGEVIYAEAEDNGISGHVAATGECYICADVANDPKYRSGLDDAASSLTVPLRLYDRILGVFNIESNTPASFDDTDRRFAQILARYIAMAMHILDLLVVERYTTNEQIAANVLGELNEPLDAISAEAMALRGATLDDGPTALAEGLDRIIEATEGIRRRLAVCTAGPKSILGAEVEMRRAERDPVMIGKRILLADNEPTVREAIHALLEQKGCDVTVCTGGAETIERLRACGADHRPYDLVISDIKMPDRSGYEVFRTAKECAADTPVILITGFGYDPHHSIVRASQEGLHSFLFKPLKAAQLLEAVTKALVGNGEPSESG
jgi:CheY-like chemotaxis protein